MDDENAKREAWDRELATLQQVLTAKRPGADPRDLRMQATGILLLSQLVVDEMLIDAVGMLRHDLERRGLATYARLSVHEVGDIRVKVADPDGLREGGEPVFRKVAVCGAVLTGTAEETRKIGRGIFQTVTIEIPRRAA